MDEARGYNNSPHHPQTLYKSLKISKNTEEGRKFGNFFFFIFIFIFIFFCQVRAQARSEEKSKCFSSPEKIKDFFTSPLGKP